MTIPETIPEPRIDIEAQIAAVADPNSPKTAAFIADGSPQDVTIPEWLFMGYRKEGILVSRDGALAEWFGSAPEITPSDMARILGYPEPNDAVEASGSAVVVQALDASGAVVMESAATLGMAKHTADMYSHFVPPGGMVAVLSMPDALEKRRAKVLRENA